MGHVQRRKQITLRFEDAERADLLVRAQSTSLGNMLDLMDLSDMERQKLSGREQKDRLLALFDLFVSCLLEWNLQHENADGGIEDTPMTREGLLLHDFDFVLDLVFAWQDGVIGVRGPLERKSGGGNPSVEALIPMDVL